MTDLSLLDWVAMILMAVLTAGMWWWGLKYLSWKDWTTNRDSQCPPHEWTSQYMDDPDAEGGHKYVGLRCGKCKRTPNSLAGGETWFGGGTAGGPHP